MKQKLRRNLQLRRRRRARLTRPDKLVKQAVQRAPHGIADGRFDTDENNFNPRLGFDDERLWRHGARRFVATIGLAEEVERAERAAGWDPNP